MKTKSSVQHILRLARPLSALDKLKIIENLAPQLESALANGRTNTDANPLDEQYQRGYEKLPEETSDIESLLPHLPVPEENWE